jgi:hypothetical protein
LKEVFWYLYFFSLQNDLSKKQKQQCLVLFKAIQAEDDDEVDDHKLEAPDAHDGVDHEDRGPAVKQEPDLGEGPSKISIGMSIL